MCRRSIRYDNIILFKEEKRFRSGSWNMTKVGVNGETSVSRKGHIEVDKNEKPTDFNQNIVEVYRG